MKKKISDFVKQFHCTTHYDGNNKVMYIRRSKVLNLKQLAKMNSVPINQVHINIIKEFGYGLPFTLA